MAERMKSLMKRSNSKTVVPKGSVTHIGTTPYRFKLNLVVSYVDAVKNGLDVCITWERRGKSEATKLVKVRDSKAIFKEALSMEHTLFRRKSKHNDSDELKFDEKKAKLCLRKGGPDGKAVGKIGLNMADYIKGTNSTVFADIKLSNGSIVVTKIEAIMLHMGKKKKNGSNAASEAYSDMTDMNSMENDSIFGDESDMEDLEIETTASPSSAYPVSPPQKDKLSTLSSPVSPATSDLTDKSLILNSRSLQGTGSDESGASSSRAPPERKKSMLRSPPLGKGKEEAGIEASPSLRDKLKGKLREKKSKKERDHHDKEKGKGKGNEDEVSQRGLRKAKTKRAEAAEAELRELRLLVESLKEENVKLRKQKQAAMEEVDALRADLDACENALEQAGDKEGSTTAKDYADMKEKEKKIKQLEAQNMGLLDELEEKHDDDLKSRSSRHETAGEILELKKRIADLEVALQREPQFLDVVNELKVAKVSLALAHMEKEQAIFALQTIRHRYDIAELH